MTSQFLEIMGYDVEDPNLDPLKDPKRCTLDARGLQTSGIRVQKMPSSQKLALSCNSRWYKESKFDSIPYKPLKFVAVPSVWNRLKVREAYMEQYQTFILYNSAGNYN